MTSYVALRKAKYAAANAVVNTTSSDDVTLRAHDRLKGAVTARRPLPVASPLNASARNLGEAPTISSPSADDATMPDVSR